MSSKFLAIPVKNYRFFYGGNVLFNYNIYMV